MSVEPSRQQIFSARLLLVTISLVFSLVAWFIYADSNASRVFFYSFSGGTFLLFLFSIFAPKKLVWWIARIMLGG